MKNLKKYFLLLVAIFPIIILLSSVFAEKASMQENNKSLQYITCVNQCKQDYPPQQYGIRSPLYNSGRLDTSKQDACIADTCMPILNASSSTPTPTPTKIPASSPLSPQSETACEIAGGSCIPTFPCVPPLQPNLSLSCGGNGVCCAPAPTATPTPPSCAFLCGTSICNTCPDGTRICGTTDLNTCPKPTPKLVWQQIAVCPVAGNCGDKNCSSNQACVGTTFDDSTYCVPKQPVGAYCGKPDKSPNDKACVSDKCDLPTLLCVDNTPAAPTPTLVPNLFDCEDQSGQYGGKYQCRVYKNITELQCDVGSGFAPAPLPAGFTDFSCIKQNRTNKYGCCKQGAPTSTPTPTARPTSTPTPTPTVPPDFQCVTQSGSYAGTYICAAVLSNFGQDSVQCPNGYSEFSRETITSCNADNKRCCKQDPLAPSPTVTPTPTSPPASVTLVMSINVQDVPSTAENIDIILSLYNLTTNSKVNGALTTSKVFVKTPIPGKQYATNISLTNLTSDKYYIVARKGNLIGRSVFSVSSSTGIITVPTAILVVGDLNNDNDINVLDHDNVFKPCWLKAATGSCSLSDFEKDGKIDQLDYNAWLRGHSAWKKAELNL